MDDNKLFSVSGNTALVIGAASGIGLAISRLYSALGGNVMMADYDINRLSGEAKKLIGENKKVEFMPVDIRSGESIHDLVEGTEKKFGRIDAGFITPGINIRKKFLDYSDDEFQTVINLNLKGNFMAMREIAKSMIGKNVAGSIVVLSSIRSIVVEPGQSAYAATKAGLVQLVRGLCSEVGKNNIRVNAIAPGVVDTPLTQQIKKDPDWYRAYSERSALNRWASVDEIAGPAVFLTMPASSFIDGTVIFVDGGWTAIDGRFEPKL